MTYIMRITRRSKWEQNHNMASSPSQQRLQLASSMGHVHHYHHHNSKPNKDLPKVLLVGPPGNMGILKPKQPQKYNLSKPWDASLALNHFMAQNHYEPSMFEALICWPWGTPINANVLKHLPCVKLVVTTSTGTNHIDHRECHNRGIKVTNVGNLYTEDVADMAVALLIDVLTNISSTDRFVRTKMWSCSMNFPLCSNFKCCNYGWRLVRAGQLILIQTEEAYSGPFQIMSVHCLRSNLSKVYAFNMCSPGHSHERVLEKCQLGGKRVGIIGLGSIGMEVAKRLEAFGCIISYHSKSKKPFFSYPFYSNMVELATTSDALVLCCSLNEQTRNMVDKEVLLALGNKGVVVNVGRGPLIDEKELVKCLMEGQIGGAGLDVFENEPNVPQELLEMDNVVLSPHNAAFTFETHMALAELVAENLEALFSNKPLITPVRLDIE